MGLDMVSYKNKYSAIRKEIDNILRIKTSFIIDLYENPKLTNGFKDKIEILHTIGGDDTLPEVEVLSAAGGWESTRIT